MLSIARLRVFSAATAALVLALLVVAATGAAALPLYLGSVGSFQVSASTIRGTGFDLALAVDGNSGSDGGKLPVGEVALGRAEIDGLVLEKDFDLGTVLGPAGGGTWTLAITTPGATTTATGLKVDATAICADTISFGPGFAVDGKGAGTEDVRDDFSLGSSTVTLGGPDLTATYLATDQITLNGLRIEVGRRDAPAPGACGGAR